MNVKVKIGPLLQQDSNLLETIELDCSTVGQCLDEIAKRFPDSKEWLYDEDSLIKVLITINNEETIAFNKEGLARVLKTGDELQIFAVVSGG